ncbi:MAG: peptide chain release factor N(5)-glutamine methyltransferase [Rickettsiales bacterium]
MKIKELLKASTLKLNQAEIPTSSLDARLLLQHAANVSIETIYLYPEQLISDNDIIRYENFLARRINNEPVAKIIGRKSFWKDDFIVNQHTLDPRPDSEVIIQASLDLLPHKENKLKFLDLGSGSGCLSLSLLREFPNAIGVASDISLDALKIVSLNAQQLNLKERIILINNNWTDAVDHKFDLIVSNPPYIPTNDITNLAEEVKNYDPILALDGGEDGLNPYRHLAQKISYLLKPGACAILEFGYDQGKAVKEIFIQHNYIVKKMLFDLNNIERAIIVSV